MEEILKRFKILGKYVRKEFDNELWYKLEEVETKGIFVLPEDDTVRGNVGDIIEMYLPDYWSLLNK